MITPFMASKKQIAWRKKFGKLYGKKKKKGSKSKPVKTKKPKSFKINKKTGSVSSPMMDRKYKAEKSTPKPKGKSWE